MSHWKDFQQVSLLAGIFFLSGMVLAVGYSGGSGIGKTPYQIGTVNDWQELIDTPTDWGKGFVLIADIDFKGQTLSPVAPDTDPGPGFQGPTFTGTLDGRGFILKNAVINQPTQDYAGAFGFVGAGAEILNLRIKNFTVTGQGATGILAGENEGAIRRCQALGTVSASGDYTGGLVGYNNGTIILSCVQGIVTGVAGWHRGGLVGYNIATISNCYAAGTVSGTGNVLGGLVGTLDGGSVTQCYSSCRIDSSASYTGGLIAYSDTGTVSSSYWDTVLSGKAASAGGAGAAGKTADQMKQQATFAGWDFSGGTASWQITENQSCPRIVSLLPAYSGGNGTNGTPYLISNTSDWLEMIHTASDYSNTFRLTKDLDFNGQVLTPVAPDMQAKFSGYFNGQHKFIRNIVIAQSTQDYAGLFGWIGAAGSVQRLNIRDISVSGRQYVGGLAAYNQGQIYECSITGSVQGTHFYVGGLVGWQENLVYKCFAQVDVTGDSGYYVGGLVGGNSNGTILQSCARGAVSSNSQYVGGLVGYNGGVTSVIDNCYATGDVTADHISGGLVGGNVCAISNCYSTGFVSGGTPNDGGLVGIQDSPGTTVRSYWDTQTSGKTTSAGGFGRTTAQMQQAATFNLWDFAAVWEAPDRNYPQLGWSVSMLTPDLNNSGVVGLDDLLLLVEHWLEVDCVYPDWCGGADLNVGGHVELNDFAILAESFDPYSPPAMTWVAISDSGAGMKDEYGNPISQGGFTGEMSKYETTNAQYAHYLNAALASGDIIVSGDYVVGAGGSNTGRDFAGCEYYYLAGSGPAGHGIPDGGAARINWTGSSFTVDAGFENHPVTYVSWYGATAFSSYYGWRLPTEWEWQAVADYDGSYTFGCGMTINNSIANYTISLHPHGTTEVGAFGTYGYEMADMAGNVWEWTSSRSGYLVVRGGSWASPADFCSVSYRTSYTEYQMLSYFGFRVCRGDMQPTITWVSIDDPGVPDHEGFTGEMSKYETTNP
ncbi:MAG: SUMF1/EgtB/PvdO family nonheme iron enzyme [Phycisphaerae bacterium]|nr:SUMF1/EgtB/PvdO family nonheme iron enzyme [Phycisphaerae bacterium]